MNCIKCKKEIEDNSLFCKWCGRKQDNKKPVQRGNGLGSVYKLSGTRKKPWTAVASKVYCGKIIRTSLGVFETKTDAIKALESYKPNDFYNITVKEAFEEYKKTEGYKMLSDKSKNDYETPLAKIEHLHNRNLRDLKIVDMQEVINNDVKKGLKRSTCAKTRLLFSQICQWGMAHDVIDRNYAEFLDLPRQNAVHKDVFTPQEIDAIITSAKQGNEAAMILSIFIYTGLRATELLETLSENVFDSYLIAGKKTAAGKDRVIPLHTTIRPFVKYFKDKGKSYLIPNSYGTAKDYKNYVNREYKPLLEILDIPYRGLHCTRHTTASELARQDVPKEIIIKILGHTDFTFTNDVYVKKTIPELVTEIEKLEYKSVSNAVSNA